MDGREASRQATRADSPAPGELLERAFARYQGELLGILYYLVGNAEDANDAYQEAFIKCWRHRGSVPGIVNLKAWIFRVTLNVGRDIRGTAWRRRSRPLPEDQSMLVSSDAGAENVAVHREELAQVRRALLDLRPEEQEVFLLRQNAQMTYEEIARTVDLPLGTVKTRMRAALRKLRQVLAPKEDET